MSEPFPWDTKASRNLMKAIMAQIIAEITLNRQAIVIRVGHLEGYEVGERRKLTNACHKARMEVNSALEVLCNEMRQVAEDRS